MTANLESLGHSWLAQEQAASSSKRTSLLLLPLRVSSGPIYIHMQTQCATALLLLLLMYWLKINLIKR